MWKPEGTPSDQLPDVLATGRTDARILFVSMSARHPRGADAAYLEWHGLDHRPEQYRLDGLRHSQRLVSTPECRGARTADHGHYGEVDHVMAYSFTDAASLGPFAALGAALRHGGRMQRLPSVELGVFALTGTIAAERVAVGADVVPWRPNTGAVVLIEKGAASPTVLVEEPGVVGAWWFEGILAPAPFDADRRGLQLTLLYLDEEPAAVGRALGPVLRRRWADTGVRGLLAAPFHTVTPDDWQRHLP
jgi:hypothetical protein